jgi:hypothetical protein
MMIMMFIAMAFVDAYLTVMTAYACIQGGDPDTAVAVLMFGAAAICVVLVALIVTKEEAFGKYGPEPMGFLFSVLVQGFAVYQAGSGVREMAVFGAVMFAAFLLLLTIWQPFVQRLRRRLLDAYESLFGILFLATTVAGGFSCVYHSWIAAVLVLPASIFSVVFLLRYFQVGAVIRPIGKP